ncbi:BLUF domain-containing protein [Variovorax sp. PCZ-1]|uniref:BLUF domain-containing protein n=1 Tax=Variovorax sp. PCZ-1 TaxID=2835533 RepID=UPI001BD10B5F|nr:BLUF domain-containing protein [Variovorax sp. PCZ-1]MBS7806248.1 BLUF domain-containing protein [Variovorax sp. PCZ-1]
MSPSASYSSALPSPASDQPRAGSATDDSFERDAGDFEVDQILYCSLLNAPMDDADIEALVYNAANLNRMDHITGMLMYADGVFVQLIEGPRQAVNHLWARLLNDKRHKGIVQLYHRREVEQRACANWDMGYVAQNDLRTLIHEAKEEVTAGRKSAWAPAIERMDFLLSNSNWDSFVLDLKKAV